MSEDGVTVSFVTSPVPRTDPSLVVDSVVQEADRLLTALSSMCTKDNTDVQIICGDRTFGCHSIILKARSMFFFKLLEGGHNVVKIQDIQSSVMDDIIRYIYTGQVTSTSNEKIIIQYFSQTEITGDKLVDTMAAASRFELPTMLEKCLKMFRNQINFDNAADVLIVSDKLGLEDFKRIAVNKITLNRTMLAADPVFRKKMVDNPDVLMLLYDNLCKEDCCMEESFRSQMSSSQTSVSSSDSGSGPLWTCVCGSTVTSVYCSWCGYSGQSQ